MSYTSSSWQCQGRDEKGRFGSGSCSTPGAVLPRLDTPANINLVASIARTEAGGEPPDHGIRRSEMIAVAFTVRNRMLRNHTASVKEVASAYAHFQKPDDESRAVARQVLAGDISDPTNGATHFYSPKNMPLEGSHPGGRDIGGGLEGVPGVYDKAQHPARNYRPSWASIFTEVHVPNTLTSSFQFFRQPGNGYVR